MSNKYDIDPIISYEALRENKIKNNKIEKKQNRISKIKDTMITIIGLELIILSFIVLFLIEVYL